jgi:hypothetical protein
MSEIMLRSNIFKGEDDMDQIEKIFTFCGFPTESISSVENVTIKNKEEYSFKLGEIFEK